MSAKTKAQLLAEIKTLQKRLAELQAVKAEPHLKNDILNPQFSIASKTALPL